MQSVLRSSAATLALATALVLGAISSTYAQEKQSPSAKPAAIAQPTEQVRATLKRGNQQEKAEQCDLISAIGEQPPDFSISYKCVPKDLCDANNYPPRTAANDKCRANNTSICVAKDCTSCHGIVGDPVPKGPAKYAWTEDKTCKHGGEGTCRVTVPTPKGLHCDCHC